MKWKKDHKIPNTKAKLTESKSGGGKRRNKSACAVGDPDDPDYDDESGSDNLNESNYEEFDEDHDEDDIHSEGNEENEEKFNPNFNRLNMNMKNKPLMI